jgi:hypothetical protein
MNDQIEKLILSKTKASQILETQLIQELWSGYGTLNRVILDNKSVILKLINLSNNQGHPKGWDSSISHKRKERSYEVEMYWYQAYNYKNKNSYTPKYIASGEVEGSRYLLLEDLSPLGYSPKVSISWEQVKWCLSWLASFHKIFLGTDPIGLWPIGTYWHLETRPEELEVLEDIKLKEAASLIDKKINSAKYKTIVHGDAKLANFLFSEKSAAAVDFQYVGGGSGIKDVVYFLSSIFQEEELHKHEKKCLDYYFKELDCSIEIEEEWRELYPYAWCDFYRFLKGWSPGHWKINSYSEQMKEKVLKWL